jgi:hypothetical protein
MRSYKRQKKEERFEAIKKGKEFKKKNEREMIRKCQVRATTIKARNIAIERRD